MRDEGDAKAPVFHVDQCQADAVNTDRPFAGHLPHEARGGVEPESGPIALVVAAFEGPQTVDMAGDQMPSDQVTQAKGLLQIDVGFRVPVGRDSFG